MSTTNDVETLDDDTVYCKIFLTNRTNETCCDVLCQEINSTISQLADMYLWHKESFQVNTSLSKDSLHCLYGVTSFGENIEDEWFIVYLVFEISKLFKNLVVQIFDSDGDFLLIEAADYLPSWANPENTINRVFIYNGRLHIIPPQTKPEKSDSKLDLKEAITIIAENREETLASPEIHAAINKRIEIYPNAIKENVHRAILKLPIDIAALLILKPELISLLVNSYCNRDIIHDRLLKNEDPDISNWVNVTVKFSKCLYAMLKSSKNNKNIRATLQKNNVDDKRLILGLKLFYGYQHIMSTSSKYIFSTAKYKKYYQNLKDTGYFKENLESSKEYTELLKKANDHYAKIESLINDDIGEKIKCFYESNEFITQKDKLISGHTLNLVEDDESWMHIEPKQLDDFLDKTYGKNIIYSKDDNNAHIITSELSNFIKENSDFEGIETSLTKETNKIEFDPDEFVSSVQNMLKIITNDNLDSDDNEDEYESEELMDTSECNLENDFCIPLEHDCSDKTVYQNIVKGLKEEGSYGPSSTVLKNIGVNKLSLLHSEADDVD